MRYVNGCYNTLNAWMRNGEVAFTDDRGWWKDTITDNHELIFTVNFLLRATEEDVKLWNDVAESMYLVVENATPKPVMDDPKWMEILLSRIPNDEFLNNGLHRLTFIVAVKGAEEEYVEE